MYALTILCKYSTLSALDDQVINLPTEYETSSQAELRALRWLMYRPNDVVMLLEAVPV